MAKIKAAYDHYKFFLLAVFFLCMKTYILYKFGFKIKTDNILQEILLMVNPLSSAVFLIGLSFLFSGLTRNIIVVVMSLFTTAILFFNLLYFRFFSDFLTWPVLFQTSNAKDLSGSVTELLKFTDLFLLMDIIILAILIVMKMIPQQTQVKRQFVYVSLAALSIFLVNLTIAQVERPQLLTRSFDREMLVKNIGIVNYHVYDGYIQSQSKAQRVFADSSDITEILDHRIENYKEPDPELFGIAEGKNIIVLSLESLQSFVINETLFGEEITPFLNELIKDSYYFDQFYHQTEQGKTSDSEFIVANSLYPRDSGAVFFTHAGNEYHSLPEILNEEGYYTSVMHANNKSFWNRDMMYTAFEYDQFFDINYYDVNEENSIGWGLKDLDFFEQSIQLLKEQPKPFYSKFITLTNHFPFELEEEDHLISEFDSNSRTLNRYFPTVRYMDYALEHFFERLKEEGIYEESIFIIYGDHYGISENHKRAMSLFLEKDEITDLDQLQLQRVPMLVHIPGHKQNEIKHNVSGQIDIKPTIMHLLGLNTKNDVQFGSDLFSPEREEFTVLRDGSVITDKAVYTKGTCYRKMDGLEVSQLNCQEAVEKGATELRLSDKVIYGDLLRFY
ncbi:LTA synthase family protein [Halalkalibacter akibai]|uniref:Lipoteichoic acid synthase LtaS Type IIIa n=1 Tax=Halalkalibacter akibai (strain ATCC 43226 / DSM 21942 / CIP 109018 / JCM 9157 / 1139) TaxID=1236973 RepID=W4QVK3_HALA3|nr:LTA synthase family protein [Halalkalibacter akibai]GAE35663.1 lipoteichoic acid synthase LtaS Type IIIa [Halalkalibacter akibai JCM 9157]